MNKSKNCLHVLKENDVQINEDMDGSVFNKHVGDKIQELSNTAY